jgi:hypothetical protein
LFTDAGIPIAEPAVESLDITIEQIVLDGLTGLFEEIRTCNWYVREHELVNLFAFGYLVPAFWKHGLDPTMIGVEFPAMQVDVSESPRFGARKDLVIWPQPRMTLRKGCDLSGISELKQLRAVGQKPLVISYCLQLIAGWANGGVVEPSSWESGCSALVQEEVYL